MCQPDANYRKNFGLNLLSTEWPMEGLTDEWPEWQLDCKSIVTVLMSIV